VVTKRLEERWDPTPIFEHLARCFAEVIDGGGTMEQRVLCLSHEVMNSVTEFVEEELDLVVGE
jgi:hypothetical protein